MNEYIKIEYKGDYIHAKQHGPDSYDASLELWQRIVAACEEHRCFNVLGETFTTVALSTMAAYDHIKIFKAAGVTREHRVAWVHHVVETAAAMQFAETVLANRGLVNGGLFPTVKEAKEWLLGNTTDNTRSSRPSADASGG